MDDLPVDEGSFIFTYPVFFLLDPTPPVTFVSRPLEGLSGYGIHVFTDEAAADNYLAANPQPAGVIKHPPRTEPPLPASWRFFASRANSRT